MTGDVEGERHARRSQAQVLARALGQARLVLIGMALVVVAVAALASVGQAALRMLWPGHAPASSGPPAPQVLAANARVYPVGRQGASLMLPAVDAQGNVWVGEMGSNSLLRLVPRSGAISRWQPPGGEYNIMATAVDAQGEVWFTEQVANYIGRFTPSTERFTTYPLPRINGRPIAPQDLRIAPSGAIWFTAVSSGQLGRLDPRTGALRFWQVPTARQGQPAYPYSLALTADGAVWYGTLNGVLGRLDPTRGAITDTLLPDAATQLFSLAADAQGRLWFSQMQSGALGMYDPRTGTLQSLPLPTVLGNPASLYGVCIAPDGTVWVASSGVNALVHYTPASQAVALYRLEVPSSVPYGLAIDGTGQLWFTAAGRDANYLGSLRP